jgi:hypothetical protein
MPTFCFDAKCSTSQTFQKSFAEVANLEDLGLYVRLSLGPRLNLSSINAPLEQPATVEAPRSVAWDKRMVLTGPVLVRQLRAAEKGCEMAPRNGAKCHSVFGGYTTDAVMTRPPSVPTV